MHLKTHSRPTSFVTAKPRNARSRDADAEEREVRHVIDCGESRIGRGDKHIVDVEQRAASRAVRYLADEVRLAHRRFAKSDIGRGFSTRNRLTDCVLHFIDVIADMAQRRVGLGERQQVVKIDGLARRPGAMFKDERGLVAISERSETFEVRLPRVAERRSTCTGRAAKRHGRCE